MIVGVVAPMMSVVVLLCHPRFTPLVAVAGERDSQCS
jgi:hypothetical protein